MMLSVLALVPLLLPLTAVSELLVRTNRCGAPTRQGLPCRHNARGRWRACHYASHRRLKRQALLQALLGRPSASPRPEAKTGAVPQQDRPFQGCWMDPPLLVRSLVALPLASLAAVSVLAFAWAG